MKLLLLDCWSKFKILACINFFVSLLIAGLAWLLVSIFSDDYFYTMRAWMAIFLVNCAFIAAVLLIILVSRIFYYQSLAKKWLVYFYVAVNAGLKYQGRYFADLTYFSPGRFRIWYQNKQTISSTPWNRKM